MQPNSNYRNLGYFLNKARETSQKEFRGFLSGAAVVTKYFVNYKVRHICIAMAIPLVSPRTVRDTTTQNCVSSDSRTE